MFIVRKGRGSVLSWSLLRALARLGERHDGTPFEIGLPDGDRLRVGPGAPRFAIQFRTRWALADTLLRGSLGLGEAYVRRDVTFDGDLEDALTAIGELYLRIGDGLASLPLAGAVHAAATTARAPRARSARREKADIERLDGRGEDFYRLYLDERLQCSSAYFRTPEDTLDVAQEQKIAHTAAKLALRPGQRLLDLGCGWGHFMLHAAETYGVECLGLTLCDDQARHIRAQAAARGLPVEVRVMSYLDIDERARWERVVSIDLMSQVGERRVDRLFDKVKALLAPGGIALLHHLSKMRGAPGTDPFVQKHIFPGYWLHSLEGSVRRASARGLDVLDIENLRPHHALTLRRWRQRLLQSYDEIRRVTGLDDAFLRAWEFYLASAAAGFRTGHMHVLQIVLSRGLPEGYPLTRDLLVPAHDRAVIARSSSASRSARGAAAPS